MDLAQIGLKADSSDLTKADKALDEFAKAADNAEKSANDFTKSQDKAEKASGRFSSTVSKMLSPLNLFKGAMIGIAAGFSVDALMKISDRYTDFTNRLKVAGLEGDAFAEVQDRLFQAANKAGAPINSLGNLYSKLSLTAKDLGASQDDMLGFIDGVTASLKVQGGDAASASGALLQLSQALGGGTVRAEEFNSILEGAPTIAQAAAKGFEQTGGSVSALRNMVISGQVSSKEFFEAFLKGSVDMKATADSLSQTLGQAFTTLSNGVIRFIGTIDQMAGISSTVATGIAAIGQGLDWLSSNLDVIGKLLISVTPLLLGAFGPAIASMVLTLVGIVGSQLVGAFSAVIKILGVLRAAMMTNPITAIATLTLTAVVALYQFREELGLTTGKWAEFWQLGSRAWEAIKNAAVSFWGVVGPLLEDIWSLAMKLWDIIGNGLTKAWEYLGPVVNGIIEGWMYGLEKTVDLLDYITGKDTSGAVSNGIDRAVDGAATKIRQAHETGGATGGARAGAQIEGAMARGGKTASDTIASAQDSAMARYAQLNGKVIEEVGKTLLDGGKYILNQATGEVTKAGTAMGENIAKSGDYAAQSMGSAIEKAGTTITLNLSQAMSDAVFAFQQGATDLFASWDQMNQIVNAQIKQMMADANLANAQAAKAGQEAMAIRNQNYGTGTRDRGSTYSGGSGGGGGMVSSSVGRTGVEFGKPPIKQDKGFTYVKGVGNIFGYEPAPTGTPGIVSQTTKDPVNVQVVNVTDPAQIPAAMSTQDGGQVFINFLRNNRDEVLAILGVS